MSVKVWCAGEDLSIPIPVGNVLAHLELHLLISLHVGPQDKASWSSILLLTISFPDHFIPTLALASVSGP